MAKRDPNCTHEHFKTQPDRPGKVFLCGRKDCNPHGYRATERVRICLDCKKDISEVWYRTRDDQGITVPTSEVMFRVTEPDTRGYV